MPDLEMELHDSLDNSIRLAGEMRAELERLRRIEQCARYLVNSNAWIGDTDGIEANLTELQELLGIPSANAA